MSGIKIETPGDARGKCGGFRTIGWKEEEGWSQDGLLFQKRVRPCCVSFSPNLSLSHPIRWGQQMKPSTLVTEMCPDAAKTGPFRHALAFFIRIFHDSLGFGVSQELFRAESDLEMRLGIRGWSS